MQPKKLSERASMIAQEAKAMLDTIRRFGPGFEKRVQDALRRSVAEEVEQAFQKVMLEVKEQNKEIEQYPTLHGDEEVWVYAWRDNRDIYLLSVDKMKKGESAWVVAAKMFVEHGAIYVPVEAFNNLIGELNTSILEGKQDENIHFTGEQLIYKKLYKAYQPTYNACAKLIL